MALAIIFRPKLMSTDRYNKVINNLEKAGFANPKGRIYHASYGNKSALNVFDIWNSMEEFEKFGETLMPILKQVNVDPGQPEIQEINNIIEGKN
jgi:virulence-associated protein VapD